MPSSSAAEGQTTAPLEWDGNEVTESTPPGFNRRG